MLLLKRDKRFWSGGQEFLEHPRADIRQLDHAVLSELHETLIDKSIVIFDCPPGHGHRSVIA